MYGFVVIGGGSVGLSNARALLDHYPGAAVVVLEQESDWARHQTDHNSGVIHSGVYYKPGILKARFSKEGARRLMEFCQEHGDRRLRRCRRNLREDGRGKRRRVVHRRKDFTGISETGDEVELRTAGKSFQAQALIGCAGLYRERVAVLGGVKAGNRMKHP
jgi:L-2-hydroxyglutarate oxidase LhgO